MLTFFSRSFHELSLVIPNVDDVRNIRELLLQLNRDQPSDCHFDIE